MKHQAKITFEGSIPNIDVLESVIPHFHKRYSARIVSVHICKDLIRLLVNLRDKGDKVYHVEVALLHPCGGQITNLGQVEDISIASYIDEEHPDSPPEVLYYTNRTNNEVYAEKIEVTYDPSDFPE